ncbi:ras-domain-containing protein, partial [Ceratobasidium sp. AG-I]
YDPSIEDTLFRRVVVDGKITDLEVVDTSGTEQFTSLADLWIRASDGFILTYSITSRRSFEELPTVHDKIVRVKQGARPTFMIVGNNSENNLEREVSWAEVQALGQQWGCLCMEASAKRGWNVERVFSDIVRALRANQDRDTRARPSQASVQTSVGSGGLKGPIIRTGQEALVMFSNFFASSREKDKVKGQELEPDRDRSRPFNDDDRTLWDMPRLIGLYPRRVPFRHSHVLNFCRLLCQREPRGLGRSRGGL